MKLEKEQYNKPKWTEIHNENMSRYAIESHYNFVI